MARSAAGSLRRTCVDLVSDTFGDLAAAAWLTGSAAAGTSRPGVSDLDLLVAIDPRIPLREIVDRRMTFTAGYVDACRRVGLAVDTTWPAEVVLLPNLEHATRTLSVPFAGEENLSDADDVDGRRYWLSMVALGESLLGDELADSLERRAWLTLVGWHLLRRASRGQASSTLGALMRAPSWRSTWHSPHLSMESFRRRAARAVEAAVERGWCTDVGGIIEMSTMQATACSGELASAESLSHPLDAWWPDFRHVASTSKASEEV